MPKNEWTNEARIFDVDKLDGEKFGEEKIVCSIKKRPRTLVLTEWREAFVVKIEF
jgi:hypothetical protein